MRDIEYSCCFTGHRLEKLPWGMAETDPRCLLFRQSIAAAVEEAYLGGIRHFISGMATGGDTYFAQAVIELRSRHPEVSLEAAIPCPGQDSRWQKRQRECYQNLLEQADVKTLISPEYTRYCMMSRNRYMVDNSSLLIAATNGSAGGTLNTIKYAVSRGKTIRYVEIPD